MRRLVTLLAAALVATGCSSSSEPEPTSAPSARPKPSPSATAARSAPVALFYAKSGAIYVSDPPEGPGKAVTQGPSGPPSGGQGPSGPPSGGQGPSDDQPAPAPDARRVAFVRKASPEPEVTAGELWVADRDGANARRLLDPASLPDTGDPSGRSVHSPQWSPASDRIAVLQPQPAGDGGALLVVDVASGGLVPLANPVFAGAFAWSPDGRHIAWYESSSDVSPFDVSVTTLGGDTTVLAEDVACTDVGWSMSGNDVLFTNMQVPRDMEDVPYQLRIGGVYRVPADGNGALRPVTRGSTLYDDVAEIAGGTRFAYTTQSLTDPGPKALWTTEPGGIPEEMGEAVAALPGGPRWSSADQVAYLVDGSEATLVVETFGGRGQDTIDSPVTSWAWPPLPAGGGGGAGGPDV